MNDIPLEALKSISEKDREAEATFSVREAADILDMQPSSVSHAIKVDKINTVNTGGQWDRVPASEVIKYGARWRGMKTEVLKERIQEKTQASDDQVFKWVVIGLGIMWLIKKLG